LYFVGGKASGEMQGKAQDAGPRGSQKTVANSGWILLQFVIADQANIAEIRNRLVIGGKLKSPR
jgi:hypothetical protein